MFEPKTMKTFNKEYLQERAIRYRGAVIHFMTSLEFVIASYISMHFCGRDADKIKEMVSIIFADDRMNLNSKAQIFHYLATKYDKEWYDSYKSVRKPLLRITMKLTHLCG